MIKLASVFIVIFAISEIPTQVYAADSGSGADGPDMAWSCWSLRPEGLAWRTSGCTANSPNENLVDLSLTVSTFGYAAWNAGNSGGYQACTAPSFGVPYGDTETDEYSSEFSGTTEAVEEKWHYQISEFSFDDEVNALGEWHLLEWPDPGPDPHRFGAEGPFQNESGVCY